MSDDLQLLELAERIEATTGEDLALFREAGAVAFDWDGNTDNMPAALWRYEEWLNKGAFIEGAMTLVPEGWRIASFGEHRHGGWDIILVNDADDTEDAYQAGRHRLPALALLAACLRAIANGADG